MKYSLKLALFLFLFLSIARFCHRQTEGFQVAKVISPLSFSQDWELPALSTQEKQSLAKTLSQPFSFLGSGGQCYAFLSADGMTVLKLYKMHHLYQYPLLYHLSLPGILDQWRIELLALQRQKLQRVFSSSKLAYLKLKEETGLHALNLNPSSEFKNTCITLVDKLGIAHQLHLENVPFALQKRADNPFKILRTHIKRRELEPAKKIVEEIYQCLQARYKKEIRDLDPSLRRNIGLIQDRAIAIDIGSFWQSPLPPEKQKEEALEDTRRMRRWLQKRSPELADYLDQLILQN